MYASVILDLKAKQLDRPFSYRIPDELKAAIKPGVLVEVPFGSNNAVRKAFVIGLTEQIDYDPDRCKTIIRVLPKSAKLEDAMISLAIWMRDRFGGTLYQSLSVVLPEKQEIRTRKERFVSLAVPENEADITYWEAVRKKYYAIARLLEALLSEKRLPMSLVSDRLNISASTIENLLKKGIIDVQTEDNGNVSASVREGAASCAREKAGIVLNEEQQKAVRDVEASDKTTHLLYGITGSGKTEVYLQLIENALKKGQDAIVLIPEISLTYQTVMRFYSRFGEKVSIVHSRLSKGEKWERFEKAKHGEIRIMIGPRSALFTPFKNLGLIIIDEFHDGSYESELSPRYNAPEVAEKRAADCNAKVVLGSATPLITTYTRAMNGEIGLSRLTKRASSGSFLPETEIVDMREELRKGNRTPLSESLRRKIKERLERNEQIMLFLNRRGYSGAVTCRSCGNSIACPHCSVSLNYHKDGTLRCHLCGYSMPMVKTCPKCDSKLIGTFGMGTEKAEAYVREAFPGIRTLRMDADTTAGKEGHEEIIEKFARHEADLLIGTQMIVKGHDFKDVTLVGILAADLSLFIPDYRSSERTFSLLLQAEGRAGRRDKPGECVIQTYNPEHYAVTAAKNQDYDSFYKEECTFRRQLRYPPFGEFFGIRVFGTDETEVKTGAEHLVKELKAAIPRLIALGPGEDNPYKLKDQYRFMTYFKTKTNEEKARVKALSEKITAGPEFKNILWTFLS